MFKVCKQASSIFMSSYEETALISGISDIVVVKWNETTYKTSPFIVCFGSLSHQAQQQTISISINSAIIQSLTFSVNKYGYLQPSYPSSQIISQLNLNPGKNIISFQFSRKVLQSQIYLYDLEDRIIISDVDGTMTKTDIMGLVSNYRDKPYMHDGYEAFMAQLVKNGYRIIWVTMRSITMYGFSKKYISKYIKCEGALLPEPEQFLPSIKKQVMKQTQNIKTNIMKKIRELFPIKVDPFVGGFGNRQNDAIAYLAVGIPQERIYLIEQESGIMTMRGQKIKGYKELREQIEDHFPPIKKKKKCEFGLIESENLSQRKRKEEEEKKKIEVKKLFQSLSLERVCQQINF